jgi:hypothetical protein
MNTIAFRDTTLVPSVVKIAKLFFNHSVYSFFDLDSDFDMGWVRARPRRQLSPRFIAPAYHQPRKVSQRQLQTMDKFSTVLAASRAPGIFLKGIRRAETGVIRSTSRSITSEYHFTLHVQEQANTSSILPVASTYSSFIPVSRV